MEEQTMSYEILKNVRITKETISFDHTSNNVFPQYFRHHEEENTQENMERMRKYLVGRVWQPLNGKRLYKEFGITHFYDGEPAWN